MAEDAVAHMVIARSPIPPAPPETELAGWVVSGRRSDAELTLADWTPIAKVLLRGEPGIDLGVRYGAAARHDWDGVSVLLVGWGPDEWLALGPPGSQRRLGDRMAQAGETVIDVTHAYAVVRLTGERAADVLAHECALDLSDRSAPDGSAYRTAVCGVAAGVIRDGGERAPSYLISCEWSHGDYLYESLAAAGKEYGLALDGLRITQSEWAIRNNARER